MKFEEFKNLVLERQSCRKFSDRKPEIRDLEDILRTALFSPSACNSQPWKIYCVADQNKAKDVAIALQDGGANAFVSEVKAFFVIAEKNAVLKPFAKEKFGAAHFVKYDIGQLSAYITLAAKAKGLDTCIIGWVNAEKLKAAVGLAPDEESNIVIAVGYGDCPLRKKTRKSFEESVEFI